MPLLVLLPLFAPYECWWWWSLPSYSVLFTCQALFLALYSNASFSAHNTYLKWVLLLSLYEEEEDVAQWGRRTFPGLRGHSNSENRTFHYVLPCISQIPKKGLGQGMHLRHQDPRDRGIVWGIWNGIEGSELGKCVLKYSFYYYIGMAKPPDLEMTVIPSLLLTDPKRRGHKTSLHRVHMEAPGLVRRQREWGEPWARAFIVIKQVSYWLVWIISVGFGHWGCPYLFSTKPWGD